MKLILLTIFCVINRALGTVSWVAASNGVLPTGAIEGGLEGNQRMYICRAWINNQLAPGKFDTKQGQCIVPYGGLEHKFKEYHVAVGSGYWIADQDGDFPSNAVLGGITQAGELMYVCMRGINGRVISGKLAPSHKVCYVADAGKEISVNPYAVLADGIRHLPR